MAKYMQDSTDIQINEVSGTDNINFSFKGGNSIDTKIGDLTDLETPTTNNLVGAINSVVESGSNANGNYIKYSDGTMICTKKVSFTNVVIDKTWGSAYETSSTFDFGNYAQAFIEIPRVSIDLSDGSTCFCETFLERTKTAIGSTWLWKPTIEPGGTMTFDIIAIGKWR